MTDEELATAPILRRPGRGLQKLPTKQRATLRLSADVLAHFRADGAGWQTRISVP
ncbi:BrnA antitoxin family protein [Plasticicumulans sp.]|uniref:BrnA antitoxin family protein n=1 Tax=Plasticicumulans sp. TaxID=2307179 RepID=UPI00395952E4